MIFQFDFAFIEIIEMISVAGDWRSQHDRDGTKDDVRALSNKLQIKSVRDSVADEFDVERRSLT